MSKTTNIKVIGNYNEHGSFKEQNVNKAFKISCKDECYFKNLVRMETTIYIN